MAVSCSRIKIPVWGEGPEGAEVTVVLEESRAVSRVKGWKVEMRAPAEESGPRAYHDGHLRR